MHLNIKNVCKKNKKILSLILIRQIFFDNVYTNT